MHDGSPQVGENNDPRFVKYYEEASSTEQARQRFRGIRQAVLRSRRHFSLESDQLIVADIGCNAGAQCECWLEAGHTVRGIDISSELVRIATQRNEAFGQRALFQVGSATSLPWADETIDICLLTELLEHVEDWETCLNEAVRVLKRGGSIFVSTTNVLCPSQQEFALPAYSWYPSWAKRHFVQLAKSTSPALANYATHPAYHWFSPYSLSSYLSGNSVTTQDRFDLIDTANKGPLARALVGLARNASFMRFLGHCLTPGTLLVGHKL